MRRHSKKPYVKRNYDMSKDESQNEVKKGSIPIESLKLTPFYQERTELSETCVKRKYACCFAYYGTNYQGLQMNPDCKSIEAELERALFLAGCFAESNYGQLQKLQWTRAARTDRGVHALGQCCSLKMYFPNEDNDKEHLITHINRILPNDIRLIGITKVTKNFNSHTACSNRKYCYIIPTYLLTPITIMNNLLKDIYEKQGPIIDCARRGGFVEPGSIKYLGHSSLSYIRCQLQSYRVSQDTLSVFRQAIQFYEGTRSYHNFTTGKDAEDDSSKRYITKCVCSEPFYDYIHIQLKDNINNNDNDKDSIHYDESCINIIPSSNETVSSFHDVTTETDHGIDRKGTEWVCVTIEGQSFVLNQIRKMIGYAIDIARGAATLESMTEAVSPKIKMDIAMAPALGLYLDTLYFTQYNIKQNRDRERKIQDNAIARQRAEQKHKLKLLQQLKEQQKLNAIQAVELALHSSLSTTSVENNTIGHPDNDVNDTRNSTIVDDCTVLNASAETAQEPDTKKIKMDNNNYNKSNDSNNNKSEKKKDDLDNKHDDDKDDNDNDIDFEEQGFGGEPILWWEDETTRSRMSQFKEEILYPHIYHEEKKELSFMYYMDYLRVKQFTYTAKPLHQNKDKNQSRQQQQQSVTSFSTQISSSSIITTKSNDECNLSYQTK